MDTDKAPDIDEVALNVLLAEGVDLPTALAASARDDDPKPPLPSWIVVVCWIVGIGVGLVIYLAM